MTRDELEIWIEANKNIKEDFIDSMGRSFCESIMRGFWWSCSKEGYSEWNGMYQKIFRKLPNKIKSGDELKPNRELPIYIFLGEFNKLEVAAIELTLMFNWEESKEGYDYWCEWSQRIYRKSINYTKDEAYG
jgi:hypothetical protein